MKHRGMSKEWHLVMLIAVHMLWGLAISGTIPVTAAAQHKAEEKYQVYDLGEIVVTGEQESAEGPTTISEVTSEEIEKQHAQDLGEALSLLPGVYFRQGRAKQESYAAVRGFEQDKVLILLDGMPIYQPYEGLVNLTDIPVQNIAKIKVIKGLSSSLYGPNAMGGVINIITKKGTTDPEASLTYQVSDYNTHHIEATHGRAFDTFGYFLGLSHKESDGFSLADDFTLPSGILSGMSKAPSSIPPTPIPTDSGRRDNSDYDRNALTFTGSWDIAAGNTLGVSMAYYNHEYGIAPAAIYREAKKGGGTAYWYPRYWRFDDWERYTLGLTEECQLSDTLRLKGRIFYDDYTSALNAYDDNTYTAQLRTSGAPSFDSSYDDYNTGGNFYGFWDGLKTHHVRLGFGFKRDVHESENIFYLSPVEHEKMIAHTYSVALEDGIELNDRLTLTLGAGYDLFEQRERSQGAETQRGDDIGAFSPQTGIHYTLSNATSLYASAGKKIRFPTMRNLYADGVIGPQGNPNLKEEENYCYELGARWQPDKRVSVEGSVFYNDIKNMILFDNQIGRFEQWENAIIHGLEVSVLAQLTAHLSARLGYTFLIAENDDSIVTVDTEYLPNDLVYKPDEIPYRPKHKVDFDLTRSFDAGVKIHLNGSYVADQIYYDHADPADNTRFIAQKESLDDFFLLNTKITWDIHQHCKIFVAIDNLLNEDYQELYLSPAPGISFWTGLKLKL